MNKFEQRQINTALIFIENNMIDAAARTVSFLIRAARREKSKIELLKFAKQYNLVSHVEFII